MMELGVMQTTEVLVENEIIKTKKVWYQVTSIDHDDIHIQTFLLQFLSWDTSRYLRVTQESEVCLDGEIHQPGTFFRMKYWFQEKRYQIICNGGQCCNYILYMENTNTLRSRKYNADHDINDESTMFIIKFKGGDLQQLQLLTLTGIPILFDKSGYFVNSTNKTDLQPQYLVPYKIHSVENSSV